MSRKRHLDPERDFWTGWGEPLWWLLLALALALLVGKVLFAIWGE